MVDEEDSLHDKYNNLQKWNGNGEWYSLNNVDEGDIANEYGQAIAGNWARVIIVHKVKLGLLAEWVRMGLVNAVEMMNILHGGSIIAVCQRDRRMTG